MLSTKLMKKVIKVSSSYYMYFNLPPSFDWSFKSENLICMEANSVTLFRIAQKFDEGKF